MNDSWWIQIDLETGADAAEGWSQRLTAAGALAVTLEDAADDPLYEPGPGETPLWRRVRVVGLFPRDTDADQVMVALGRTLTGDDALPRCNVTRVDDQDWERAWMDRFHPMRFGKRLWVCPSWKGVEDPAAVSVLLDPGLAFGTGTHPTTALCLEWLDGHIRPGMEIVDYGCGSGILAIAALKLGAGHCTAVDNDPQALTASRENARRNGVETRLSTLTPEQCAASCPAAGADLVVANILARPLIELAPVIGALVRPGGLLVLSGIIEDQANAVARAYANEFRIEVARIRDQWVRLAGRKTGHENIPTNKGDIREIRTGIL